MGLGRIAENIINLQKCFIDVADLSQNTEFLMFIGPCIIAIVDE